MNKYLKLLIKLRPSEGWTLMELLLASSLTLVVVGGAGYGLLSVLNSNKIANATNETQQMLNFGMEFVTEEIQAASKIDPVYNAANANRFESLHGSDLTIIPVLSLKINGLSQRVIYYTRDLSPGQTAWAGPVVLYRLGPYLKDASDPDSCPNNINPEDDDDPTYCNPTTPSEWGDGEALIDLIASRTDLNTAVANGVAQKNCSNPSWTRMPANDTNLRGFFVCVRPLGDLAEVRALSAMTIQGIKTSGKKPVTYELATQVATRSTENIPPDGGGAVLNMDTMKPNMPVNIAARAIYTIPSCQAPAPSAIQLKAGSGTFKLSTISQALGTNSTAFVSIGGIRYCSVGSVTYQSYSNADALRAKNGDTISDLFTKFAPTYPVSQLATAITNLENIIPGTYFDSTTRTIKLPKNQNLLFMGDPDVNPATYNYGIILTTVTKQ